MIELGVERRVILATPTTLIALLRAVAYGWRQEKVAASAQEISELGRQLYERIATLGDYFSDVGSSLKKAVESYNSAVNSLESRLLPGARKFLELGVNSKKEMKELKPVESAPLVPRVGEEN